MRTEDQLPPRWANRLLKWYCRPKLLEEIEGDLQEEFEYQTRLHGLAYARIDYVRHVIGFMRPFAIRNKTLHQNSPVTMNLILHYFVTAWRNLLRYRAFSAINILGLALGMTCCLFIMLWVRDEVRIDNFSPNISNVYAVYETISVGDQITGSYTTAMRYDKDHVVMGLGDAPESVPEVEAVAFYATGYELPWGHAETLQIGEVSHKRNGSRASTTFLSMRGYPIVAGDPKSALRDWNDIALSRSTCSLFFKTPEEAIGKTIRFENTYDLIVTCVFEDVGPESSLKFDFLLSWEAQVRKVEWSSNFHQAFIQLKPGSDPVQVAKKLTDLQNTRKYYSDPGYKAVVGLQPLSERYLFSTFANGVPQTGPIEYVRIFSGVAVFILLMACINFMNLATARSVKRAKEVGIRKTVGSSRFHLILQFYGEAVLLSALAIAVSMGFVYLLLPSFNSFTGKSIDFPVVSLESWIMIGGLAIASGIISGSYPALFLSALKPASILKGVMRFTSSSVYLRKGLAVFQFALSITLLIATFVITEQTWYVQHWNLGYDKENLLYFRIEGKVNDKYAVFKDKAMKMPGIAMIDRSSEAPHAMGFVVDEDDGLAETNNGQDAIQWEGKTKKALAGFKPSSVGFDFVRLMNLKLVDGRDFSHDVITDSADAFLVNEEAVRQMGMKAPIGKWVSAWAKKGHIIGILKDYNTHSLREPIKPVILDVKEHEYFGVVLVRTEPGKTQEALESLTKVYKEINPNFPFQYEFVDVEYGNMYRNEQVMASLSNAFAFVGIAISCLGLLGLVMFSAEQRVREIGIRKVLGASVFSIVTLLSSDFLKLIAIAFLFAVPIGGYFMNQWLQGFAFKIDLSWWIFAASGIGATLIALLTISMQAFQSAAANPVKSLKAD